MQTRRKLDQVLDPAFITGLEEFDQDEVRRRRQLAHDVENELSYYRRMLHGRMDLLRFEQRRRSGEESRDLIEALAEILSDGDGQPEHPRPGGGQNRFVTTDLPPLPETGKREVDDILGSDVLCRLDELDDKALAGALAAVGELEVEISDNRHRVQEIEDLLSGVVASRLRAGEPDPVG